jgi:hypothetical protein
MHGNDILSYQINIEPNIIQKISRHKSRHNNISMGQALRQTKNEHVERKRTNIKVDRLI